MIEALGSSVAFFVPKTPLFRGKNRLRLPNYYPMKWQIFLEIRVVNGAKKDRREACLGWQISLRMSLCRWD